MTILQVCFEGKEKVSVTGSILGWLILENNLSHGDKMWMCTELYPDVQAEAIKYLLYPLPPCLSSKKEHFFSRTMNDISLG